MTAQTPPPGHPVPAGLGRRLAANVLDSLIYLGLTLACVVVPFVLTQSVEGIVIGYLLYVVVGFVYAVVQWKNLATRGQTTGKKAMGLWVLDEASGTPLGWGRTFVRQLVLAVASALVVPFVVLAVMAASHPRRQGWHDRAARSVVVTFTQAAGAANAAGGPVDRQDRSVPPVVGPAPAAPMALSTGYAGTAPPTRDGDALASTPADPAGPIAPPAPVMGIAPPPVGIVAPPPVVAAPSWEPSGSVVHHSAPVEHTVVAPARPSHAVPAAWRLVGAADGQVIVVDASSPAGVVVGRDPLVGPHVGARPVAVDDVARSMSKTHARLTVDAGTLVVEDLGSTNGVYVTIAGAETRVPAHVRTPVEVGSTVSFGDRAFEVGLDTAVPQ
jgi:uncharacterized RDD family membrane protein YckC